MAIDSENKRRSVMGIMPIPDGVIDAVDRMHISGHYRFEAIEPVETSDLLVVDEVLSERSLDMEVNIIEIEGEAAAEALQAILRAALRVERRIFVPVRPYDTATGLRKA